MNERTRWAVILLLLMAVWATFHPVSKLLLEDFSPLTVSFIRLAFAMLFFVPYMAWKNDVKWPQAADWRNILINAGLGTFASALLINTGLSSTTASASAVLVNTTPIFVALIAAAFFHHPVSRLQAGGLVAAFLGMALVATQGDFSGLAREEFLSGNLLSLAAAACIAIATFAALPTARRFGSVQAQFWGILPGVVGFFAVWLAAGEWTALGRMTLGHWLGFAWIGIVISGICWSIALEAMHRFGAVMPSAFKTLIPAFAVLYSVLFLGETLDAAFLIGMAAVLVGLYFVQRQRPKPSTTQSV